MKATSVVCPKTPIPNSGRITRRRDIENEEIQMYISKLKDLVPFTPKNKKLTKLEVIEHAIAYILDLQTALEAHPAVNAFDAATALNQRISQGAISPRQPLGLRQTPNTILAPCEAPTLHITTPEKLSPSDGRPVSSC